MMKVIYVLNGCVALGIQSSRPDGWDDFPGCAVGNRTAGVRVEDLATFAICGRGEEKSL